ncbi:GIY-YIG nuclease family protein [Kribbella italica]|uniref:Putative GIY-YIG superfamily endonuclease n=1 Tax=Kribbella italica TaxID=1540520 RepID=A0A7W9JDH5_9ACTN|nr:putative GIY-YIG superfamily endonuclease [Kribbella italica]
MSGVLREAAAEAPGRAGVYLFLGASGEVLYVGKAGNLRQRLAQHAAAKGPRVGLAKRYDLVRRVVWEVAASEEAAAWRESELIFALRPPYNANTGVRGVAAVGQDARVPYLVVREEAAGVLRFALETGVPGEGRAYGCFPHLGKGVASSLGIACSDGYTALLRLLWASGGAGDLMPGAITRSAPGEFSVVVDDRTALHGFLSGTRAKLVDELLLGASERPAFMMPALRRDREAALRFFAGGPRLVRERRLRHGVRGRVLEVETYRRLVREEIAPVIKG